MLSVVGYCSLQTFGVDFEQYSSFEELQTDTTDVDDAEAVLYGEIEGSEHTTQLSVILHNTVSCRVYCACCS
jgi:hypothetical protein